MLRNGFVNKQFAFPSLLKLKFYSDPYNYIEYDYLKGMNCRVHV